MSQIGLRNSLLLRLKPDNGSVGSTESTEANGRISSGQKASPPHTHTAPKRKPLPAYPGPASKLVMLWKGGAA